MTKTFACTIALLALLVGCGGDGGSTTTHDCADIIAACHEVDPGSGPIHDCHEVGHDGDEAACTPVRASCVSMCEAAEPVDGGAHMHDHDGGAHMHDHDGGAHMHGEDGGGGGHMH